MTLSKILPNHLTGLNCEKNAVVCEGYHEKTLWKSGREKAEEGEGDPDC